MAKADSDQLFGAVLQRLANTYLKPAKGNCSAPTLLKALSPASTGGSTGRKLDFTPYVPSERNLRVWLQNMGVPGASNQEGFVKLVKFTLNISDEEERSLDAAINLTRRISVKEREAFKIDRIGGLIARGPREKTESEPDPLAAGSVQVFAMQAAAYHYLVDNVLRKQNVAAATLIQHSCESAFNVLRAILRSVDETATTLQPQHPAVRLFVQHPDIAAALGSKRQEHRIHEVLTSKLPEVLEEKPHLLQGRLLQVRVYTTPGYLSGLHVTFTDDTPAFLMLGNVTYDKRHDYRGKGAPGDPGDVPRWHSDTLDYSAHDRAAVLAREGSRAYTDLLPTFEAAERNLSITAMPLPLPTTRLRPLGKAEVPPAPLAFFRDRYLFPSEQDGDHEPSPATALALWDEDDYAHASVIVGALLDYFLKKHMGWQAIARYQLLLGWITREQGAVADTDKRLEAAQEHLRAALTVYTEHGFPLWSAYCHDHLGAVLRRHGEVAEVGEQRAQFFHDAMGEHNTALQEAHKSHDSDAANTLHAWVYLNMGCLVVDEGKTDDARDYLHQSLRLFHKDRDSFGISHCVAALARLARWNGDPNTALLLLGAALDGSHKIKIMPTYRYPLLEDVEHWAPREMKDTRTAEQVRGEGANMLLGEAVDTIVKVWSFEL